MGRRVIEVQEGQEPLVFRARFQAWDDGGPGEIKKFEDVYEQRMVQMTVSDRGAGSVAGLRRSVLFYVCYRMPDMCFVMCAG